MKIIDEYIRKNATSTIQRRANTIALNLKKHEDALYVFSYQGSASRPYKVEVCLWETKVTSSCTCPYNRGGLCKHEVAALRYVKKNPMKKQLDLFGNEVKDPLKEQINKGKIILNDHLITDDLINRLIKILKYDPYNTWKYIYIKEIDFGLITYVILNHDANRSITLVYNPKTQELNFKGELEIVDTSLIKALLIALTEIVKDFGNDFFSPKYLENIKKQFIKDHNITEKHLKYYDFNLTEEGIEIESNIKNLYTKPSDFYTNLISFNETEKDIIAINKIPEKLEIETHGFGFYIDFFQGYNGVFFPLLYPFYGKYKKHTKELATSFKKITDLEDLEDLEVYDSLKDEEKIKLINAVQTNTKIERTYSPYEVKISEARKHFIKFKNLINSIKNNYPIFYKPSSRDRFVRKNLVPLEVSEIPAQLHFVLKENDDFLTLNPKIRMGNKSYQVNSVSTLITAFFCLLNKKSIHFFNSTIDAAYLFNFAMEKEVNFPIEEKEEVIKNVVLPLTEHFEVENKIIKPKKLPKNTHLKKEIYLSDYEGEFVVFKLGVRYGDELILSHTNELIHDKKTNNFIKRDTNFEDEFIEYFKELHPDFQEQSGIFYLEPHQLIEDEWLLKASQKLKQQDVEIFGAKDLKSFKYSLHQASVSMGVTSDIDWFDLDIEVKFGKEKVSLKDIRKAVINQHKYVQLKDGTLGILPDKWLKKFAKYFKAGQVGSKGIKVSNYQFNIIDDLYEDLETTPQFLMDLKKKKEHLQNLKNVTPVKLPKTVKASLRPYQQEGLNWLVFLNENELGGCLADDMGLGKTLQTIALLAYLKSKKKAKKPSLIVAPTSLIFNWQKEFEKFAPSIKILIYTGIERKKQLESFEKYDVVITTYGSVLRDIEDLQKKVFYYVILDESQAIKNPNSKRYKSVRLLNAENRLVLTGTPIENNTFDLYSQMNFINPGLLGAMSHFKSEFSDAIDKAKNKEASDLLHEMIYPFLLRRTKTQVATDLPEKTENILYCEMGSEQRKVYEVFKNKYREYLLQQFEENGESKSQMYVLEGLTKLRQICNSPQLLSEEEEYTNASVKLDTLLENIKTITSERSKVLVFSQFTSMLALIQERLETENIAYEYLDGQTRNREEKVQNFQENDAIKVFLISLKAGGTGLNLTKAEYVFLVDPWWNPAVENQAIDRCYRIGQTQNVIAYRMICKDTIEEKIVALQDNKKAVSDSIIQVDKTSKSFDKKRVKELFS